MNPAYFGIIGTLLGIILGFALPNIKEYLNRKEPLYIEISKAYFTYPVSDYHDLIGSLNIYLFNNSSEIKTFLLEEIKTANPNPRWFNVYIGKGPAKSSPDVIIVNPRSALNLTVTMEFLANGEISAPDINASTLYVTYRSGKVTNTCDTKGEYYNNF